jgi:hypothetical protein
MHHRQVGAPCRFGFELGLQMLMRLVGFGDGDRPAGVFV